MAETLLIIAMGFFAFISSKMEKPEYSRDIDPPPTIAGDNDPHEYDLTQYFDTDEDNVIFPH